MIALPFGENAEWSLKGLRWSIRIRNRPSDQLIARLPIMHANFALRASLFSAARYQGDFGPP
jgi:hypothetical protein